MMFPKPTPDSYVYAILYQSLFCLQAVLFIGEGCPSASYVYRLLFYCSTLVAA